MIKVKIERNEDTERLTQVFLRREYLKNKDYVYKALKEDKKLIIHPIKFNSIPDALIWLDDIFNH